MVCVRSWGYLVYAVVVGCAVGGWVGGREWEMGLQRAGLLLPSLSLQGCHVSGVVGCERKMGRKGEILDVVRMDVVVRRRCVEIWVGSMLAHSVLGEIWWLCLIVWVVMLRGLLSPLVQCLIKFFEA